jgi:hypothetical protein
VATEALPSLEAECFFVAPIGSEGSDTRERSDGVLEYIVVPAAHDLGLIAVRADKIAKPGQITRQVIEHVLGAKAAVVDLTDANPNVYYEMAVRHTAQLPTVLIAQDGEKLPFDISQMRTIFFDHTSLKSAAECRTQITQHLKEALGGEVDSPITASVTVQRLEHGTSQERVLAQLVDGVDELRTRLRHMDRPLARGRPVPSRVRRDLERGWMLLEGIRLSGDVSKLETVIDALERPMRYVIDEGPYDLPNAGHGGSWQEAIREAGDEDRMAAREIARMVVKRQRQVQRAQRDTEREGKGAETDGEE